MAELSDEWATTEQAYSVEEAKELAREDLDFFGSLAVPEVMELAFAPTLHLIWQMLTVKLAEPTGMSRFAIGLPRGHAKSTVVKLLVLWSLFYSRKRFVLIVAASQPLAENILADICDILSEENIVALFGDYRLRLEKDAANVKKFYINDRPVVLAAAGVNSSVRGLALKFARPDFMIFDDAQTREIALSPKLAQEFQDSIYGTWLKLKAPQGCTYVYIGNMYKNVLLEKSTPERPLYGCLLRNLKDDKNWTSFITGAILADGEALWPELHSRDALLDELAVDRAAGQEDTWFAEIQNDPEAQTANRFDYSAINIYKELQNPGEGAFLVIDPSRGKANSDQQPVLHVEIVDGVPHLHHLAIEQVNPKMLIENCLKYCLNHNIPLICVEAVGYQETLKFWFDDFIERLGIASIVVQPLSPKSKNKNFRILAWFKSLFAGLVPVHKSMQAQLLYQIQNWDPLEKNNKDDILDCGAYITDVMTEYKELTLRPFELEMIHGAPEEVEDWSANNLLAWC